MRPKSLEVPSLRAAAALAALLALQACGTVKGMGSDITSVYQTAATTVGLSGPAHKGGFNVYDPGTATWHH